MEVWILFAVVAAMAQTVRFALQKVLAGSSLTAAGATYARFVWSAPLATGLAALYAAGTNAEVIVPSLTFLTWAVVGGLFQILATILTVMMFRRRAFAIGITFKKTEVLLTALVGFVVLGDQVSFGGLTALIVGFAAVVLLAETPRAGQLIDRSSVIGLGSGICFAVSAVAYRGATLALPIEDPILVGGATLAVVTWWQTFALGLWLIMREPGQVSAVLAGWRRTGLVGVFSLIGSWCWFSAFSLANAAYVFAVGQVELIFSLALGWLWFGERLSQREALGAILLTLSIIGVVALG